MDRKYRELDDKTVTQQTVENSTNSKTRKRLTSIEEKIERLFSTRFSFHCRVTTLGKLLIQNVPLSPSSVIWRWCCAAGKVTASQARSNSGRYLIKTSAG